MWSKFKSGICIHRQSSTLSLYQFWLYSHYQIPVRSDQKESSAGWIKLRLIFSRAVLCCLTWNSLGTEVSYVRRVDDVQTTRGRRADDVRTTREWDFVGDFRWRMTYVVRTSSTRCLHVVRTSFAGRYVIYMLSAHAHVIRTSSASHPHHSSWSVWAWTIFYCDRNLLFDGICGRNVELFHFRIM